MPDPVYLCDATDCERLMSAEGVTLRTDDDPESILDCCEEGSAYVLGFLSPTYDSADLAEVPIIRFIARFFACCAIFRRRGEGIPEAWKETEKKYEAMLMKFADGTLPLMATPQPPGGPAVSNQEYDLENYPQAGVSRPRSSSRGAPVRRRYDYNADAAQGHRR